MKKVLLITGLIILAATSTVSAGQVCFWQKGRFCPLGTRQVDSGMFGFEPYVYCCGGG